MELKGKSQAAAGLPRQAVTRADVVAPHGVRATRRSARPSSSRVPPRRRACARALAAAPSLHEWARAEPGATAFQGRATAWGVRLPRLRRSTSSCGTRAAAACSPPYAATGTSGPDARPGSSRPRSACASWACRTPDVVAYALYPAGRGFCRCDVITAAAPRGRGPARRVAGRRRGDARRAARRRRGTPARPRARPAPSTPTSTRRTCYVAREGERWHAWVLDVDRVRVPPSRTTRSVGDAEPRTTRTARCAKRRERDGLDDHATPSSRGSSHDRGGAARVTPGADGSRLHRDDVAPSATRCTCSRSSRRSSAHHPAMHVTWVLQAGPAMLVRGHPAVDEIVLFDRSKGWRGLHRDPPRTAGNARSTS